MSKNKKKLLLIIVAILIIGIIVIGSFCFYKLNKIVTILTMDINPSLKLSLNYKNKVIKVESLNEDAKELLKENNFKGKDLEYAIEEITEKVLEKEYITDEDNYILINVEGNNIEDKVVKIINNKFKENNKECNIIKQEVNEDAKENAKKYGISDNKASYIENILKENKDLKFEDLKDKSINEINKIVNNIEDEIEQEKKEEEKEEPIKDKNEEENKQNSTINNSSNNNSINNMNSNSTNNIKPVTTPPASNDRTGAWCEFYKTIPPEGGVEYETPGYISNLETYKETAKNYMPEDADWSQFFQSITEYRTGSYCSAGIVELENYDKTKTYTAYIDSVTLELLELKTTDIVKPNIDEAGARVIVTKWLMDKYNIDINNCGWESYYYAIDGSTKIPEWQYICKVEETTTYYTVTVVATDGSLKNDYTWTN